jgi:PAN domain
MTRKLITALLLILGVTIATQAHAADTLYAGQYLFSGQSLVAPSCYYKLVFQSDGNLVLYTHSNAPVWASGTQNSGAAYAVMQGDGNLVLYTWGGRAVWSTGTYGHPYARTALQDDGNLVVYTGGAAIWASNTVGESLGTNVCPPSSVTSTELETNRYGGDYMFWELNSPVPIWCSYFCSQDARCKSYTYVPPGVQGAKARCWLKDSIPAQSYAPGLMSGVIYR